MTVFFKKIYQRFQIRLENVKKLNTSEDTGVFMKKTEFKMEDGWSARTLT
jgi:hypothetical protein